MTRPGKSWSKSQVDEPGQARYEVAGEPSSQFLMRIFGLLAQQDLLPEQATVHNSDGVLVVQMQTAQLSHRRAEVIAEKMRSLVEAHRVEFAWRAPLSEVPELTDRPCCASGLRED